MNPSQPYPSQTYAQQAYPSSAGGATTTTTVQTSRVVVVRPYFDIQYIKTIPGILKIVQLVLMLLAFILAAAAWTTTSYFISSSINFPYCAGSAGWTKFVTITGFIITLILLNLYLFHLIERFYQINWLLTECMYCAITTVLLFIAGCVMIPYAWADGTRGACVFFSWAAACAYAADAFFKFRSWRNGEVAQGTRPSSSVVTNTTSYPPPYPTRA